MATDDEAFSSGTTKQTQNQSDGIAGSPERAAMNLSPRPVPVYTDDDLVMELRHRAQWKSVAGSKEFRQVLIQAAERIEQAAKTPEKATR